MEVTLALIKNQSVFIVTERIVFFIFASSQAQLAEDGVCSILHII